MLHDERKIRGRNAPHLMAQGFGQVDAYDTSHAVSRDGERLEIHAPNPLKNDTGLIPYGAGRFIEARALATYGQIRRSQGVILEELQLETWLKARL
jgi:hypothetical protein